MSFPKLKAAIDEVLAEFVKENAGLLDAYLEAKLDEAAKPEERGTVGSKEASSSASSLPTLKEGSRVKEVVAINGDAD